jgi:uncharacterized protein (DUF1330 family)
MTKQPLSNNRLSLAVAPIAAILTAEKAEVLEDAAPKRVVISQWKSMDDAKKFYSSEVVKTAFENRKKFTSGGRTFVVEALPN